MKQMPTRAEQAKNKEGKCKESQGYDKKEKGWNEEDREGRKTEEGRRED